MPFNPFLNSTSLPMGSEAICTRHLLLLLLFLCFSSVPVSLGKPEPSDAEALLALKSAVDPYNSLPWRRESASELCTGWSGVMACFPDGRVTKLVLEVLNLTGALSPELLAPLDQLRVLSFKSNDLSGAVPDLSRLANLKSLYLSGNRFSGPIPASLAVLHRLKIVVLSGNRLSGSIPLALAALPRLYSLQLQDNNLTGKIPAFDQPSLKYFNVSGNNLSGGIPATRALSQFNASSFVNNPGLCGSQIQIPCSRKPILPPSISPESSVSSSSSSVNTLSPLISSSSNQNKTKKRRRVIAIIASSVAGGLFLSILLVLLLCLVFPGKRKSSTNRSRGIGTAKSSIEEGEGGGEGGGGGGEGGKKGGGFSWEGEGLGKLVFVGGPGESFTYGLEELLRASAETLGRGTVGSTYKAVMETGYIVTVKRLRDPGNGRAAEEFRGRAEELGRLRHPNLVPLRAYFQAKDERLLVYDYFPNGSLFALIHGSRPSGSGKPLHWTSCLKIAEDAAGGLLHLHAAGVVHGNLKPSNVLLGPDFESCLSDFGLLPGLQPQDLSSAADSSSSLFYRAPESRGPSPSFTAASDVYSFGVLLLELLTGKTPFQDLVEAHGDDIPKWVKELREEESAESAGSGAEAEEKLAALVGIAAACLAPEAARRPATRELVRMVREARAEAMISSSNNSNSSDRDRSPSPGRWSDSVVQSQLPREHGSEGINFGERD